MARIAAIALILTVVLLTATPVLALNTSDRIEVLEEYHGYYPCMDCHEDQESNPTPRILEEEHEIPLEWEDDEGETHLVEFGEWLSFADLLGQSELKGLAHGNMLRIGRRLDIENYMAENDYAPGDSLWVLTHGGANLWCLDCHSATNRDMLHKLNGEELGFNESHLLCGQCHGPVLRDWEHGVHGRSNGYWNLAMDEDELSTRLLCVECHIPHAPKFRGLPAMPAPVTRIDNISQPEHVTHEVPPAKLARDILGPHPWQPQASDDDGSIHGDDHH
jgi:hypothetical protein